MLHYKKLENLLGTNTLAYSAHSLVLVKLNVLNMSPGTVFTTLQNLLMYPIRYNVTLQSAGKLARDKHSSLLGPFLGI